VAKNLAETILPGEKTAWEGGAKKKIQNERLGDKIPVKTARRSFLHLKKEEEIGTLLQAENP